MYYVFYEPTGQVTYRVVQVTGDGTESAQVVATNAFQPGAQVNRKKMFIMFNRKY